MCSHLFSRDALLGRINEEPAQEIECHGGGVWQDLFKRHWLVLGKRDFVVVRQFRHALKYAREAVKQKQVSICGRQPRLESHCANRRIERDEAECAIA